MHNPIPTINIQAPSAAYGKEAVEAARTYSVPLHRTSDYLEGADGKPGTYTARPAYTPGQMEDLFAGALEPDKWDSAKVYQYRDHVFVLEGERPAILDSDGDAMAYLEKGTDSHTAAAWLDGYLLGRERGEGYGLTRGQYQTEQKFRDVAGLLLGPLAGSLERIAATLEEKHS